MGKAKSERVNQVFSMTMIVCTIVTVLLALTIFLGAPAIAHHLAEKTGSSQIHSMITRYLQGVAPGTIFMRFTMVLSGIMMLDNDKNRSIMALGATFIADLVFDLANVLIFHGDMYGMAVATTLSNLAGFIVILTHFLRKNHVIHFTLKGLRISDISQVVKSGVTNAISLGSISLRTYCYNILLLSLAGGDGVASYSVCSSAFSIVNAVGLGFLISSSLLSSLLFGEEDRTGLEKGTAISIRNTVIIFSVLMMVFILFPQPIARLFVQSSSAGVMIQGSRFIRYMAIQFMFMSLTFSTIGIYQGTGHLRLAYLVDVMRQGVFPVICVMLPGHLLGVRGMEAGFVLAGLLSLVLCCLITWKFNGKFPVKAKDFLILPDDFGAKKEEIFEVSMKNMDDVMEGSQQVMEFCHSHGADSRTAFMLSLFVEEMATNTVSYGFEGRTADNGSIDLRLVYREDSKTIRLRDNGKPFDPVKWLEKNSTKDPTSGIGIRLVTGLAKNVQYIASMEMNNLIIQL